MPTDSPRESHFPAIEKKVRREDGLLVQGHGKAGRQKISRTDRAFKRKLWLFAKPCQRPCYVFARLFFIATFCKPGRLLQKP